MVVARLILVVLNTPVEKLIFFSMISTEAKISLTDYFCRLVNLELLRTSPTENGFSYFTNSCPVS